MAPQIQIAPLATRLANCAEWHFERAEHCERNGNEIDAERHHLIAFRLFRAAHEAKNFTSIPSAA